MDEPQDARTLAIVRPPASVDTVPVATIADLLLLAIARRRPNAIMVEPEDDQHVVRCELHGRVSTLATMSPAHGDAVAARLVLIAGLDLVAPSEIGRIRFRVRDTTASERVIDVLVLARTTPSGIAIELRPLLAADEAAPAFEPGAVAWGSGTSGNALPSAEGSYRLLDEIGRGGMGIVFRAEHVLLQKHVALKVLSPGAADDPDMIAQFLVEARAACRARHPGIVDVTDFGWLPDGRAYYVMELVEAQTLEDVISREKVLAPARAIAIARHIAEVLRTANASGIVHRDLKPGNVFVLRGDRVKVGDFGLARIVGALPVSRDARSDSRGLVAPVGTPGYMSPEQGRSELVDVRSDIYSLACVLFEMLTGRMPYVAKNLFSLLEQHQSAPIPALVRPDGPVPDVVAAVVRRGMAKRREERHQSPEELIADLDRADRALERRGWRRWLPT